MDYVKFVEYTVWISVLALDRYLHTSFALKNAITHFYTYSPFDVSAFVNFLCKGLTCTRT